MRKRDVREEILNAAFGLYYEFGFHATGMDSVIERASVTRATLYKYFPSKQALILAVLERRNSQWMSWFQDRVVSLAPRPQDRMLAVFDALQEWFDLEGFHGCSFINVSAEFTNCAHPAHQIASAHVLALRDFIRDLCAESGIPTEPLADQLALVLEGAIVMRHVAGDPMSASKAKGAASALLGAFSQQPVS